MEPSENIQVDFDLAAELAPFVIGGSAYACFQCGACVAECPTAAHVEGFSPRKVVLQILLGDRESFESEDALVWKCSSCFTCLERCPQGVRPGELIAAVRNWLVKKALVPKQLADIYNAVRKEGRTVPRSSAIDRRRKELGLPVVPDAPVDELKSLLPQLDRGKKEKK
ncbi:MAG: 4Fe-4S dicluster domain-containing protein [Planctomycetota bacterium]|nr:4Fe-4S dicluster domain-containing protein [Planctomycetota bacterium]